MATVPPLVKLRFLSRFPAEATFMQSLAPPSTRVINLVLTSLLGLACVESLTLGSAPVLDILGFLGFLIFLLSSFLNLIDC